MNQQDQHEVMRLIAESRKGFPLWAKESMAFGIVMGGAVFIILNYIPAQIGSQTSSIVTDVGTLKESVGTLKTEVSGIRQDIKDTLNRALDRAYQGIHTAQTETKRGALELGNSALQLANDLHMSLGNVANNFGLGAITAFREIGLREIAWQGVTLALTQKTLTEEIRAIISGKSWQELQRDKYGLLSEAFSGNIVYSTPQEVPFDQCFLSVDIGHEEQARNFFRKQPQPSRCPEYIRFVGGHVPVLDGQHFKNVIFENVRIVYHGGPLILENVIFLNCSFDLAPKPDVAHFATIMFQSKEVTFDKAG